MIYGIVRNLLKYLKRSFAKNIKSMTLRTSKLFNMNKIIKNRSIFSKVMPLP